MDLGQSVGWLVACLLGRSINRRSVDRPPNATFRFASNQSPHYVNTCRPGRDHQDVQLGARHGHHRVQAADRCVYGSFYYTWVYYNNLDLESTHAHTRLMHRSRLPLHPIESNPAVTPLLPPSSHPYNPTTPTLVVIPTIPSIQSNPNHPSQAASTHAIHPFPIPINPFQPHLHPCMAGGIHPRNSPLSNSNQSLSIPSTSMHGRRHPPTQSTPFQFQPIPFNPIYIHAWQAASTPAIHPFPIPTNPFQSHLHPCMAGGGPGTFFTCSEPTRAFYFYGFQQPLVPGAILGIVICVYTYLCVCVCVCVYIYYIG
jgi:hypothetical protein